MDILFIGNSHTHVNNVPASVQALLQWASQDKDQVQCFACTTDSVSLEWHWGRQQTHARLKERAFAFVVLQERSGGPTEKPESTRKYGLLWSEEVQRRGAVPVIYGTWALAHDLAGSIEKADLVLLGTPIDASKPAYGAITHDPCPPGWYEPPRRWPIPVRALQGATSYWACVMANSSGHMSHRTCPIMVLRARSGRWLLPTSWPAWPAYRDQASPEGTGWTPPCTASLCQGEVVADLT